MSSLRSSGNVGKDYSMARRTSVKPNTYKRDSFNNHNLEFRSNKIQAQ